MQFTLIRHAEPEWVKDGLSVVNPPLTARGYKQAERLAGRLADMHFYHIYVWPLLRTRQTAKPLLDINGRAEIIEPWLEEIREPSWHGAPAEETIKAYRDEMDRNAEDRWSGLEGGESVRDFVARIHAGCAKFLADRGVYRLDQPLPVWQIDDPGDSIALFAHAGTDSVLICHFLGLQSTPWEWERFIINHASITTITSMKLGDGYTFSLTSLSDSEHLDSADRTR
ncbi:MAG: histidine phosphatase family protein [Actinomycetota bacterium]